MPEKSIATRLSLAFIFLAAISSTGLLVPRYASTHLMLSYSAAFFAYLWIAGLEEDQRWATGLGLAARLVLFWGMPTLSDDIYRFIWDGQLVLSGIDPYALAPDKLLGKGETDPGLFRLLNSQQYHSVYPPSNQLLFALGAWVGHNSWLVATNALRFFLLMADIGSFILLRQLLASKQLSPHFANWYFLNPLVILEFTGNVHFEGLVIFFLLLTLWLVMKDRVVASGLALGTAIGIKLLPAIFLPVFLFGYRWKKGFVLCLSAFLASSLLVAPMVLSDSEGIYHSFQLYFRKFEFNASLYFLIREIGFWVKGYNIIGTLGPALSLVTFASILAISCYGARKKWPPEKSMLLVLLLYLLLSTTVHPWYTVPLVAFGVLSGYRFPLVWSWLVFFTYLGYTQAGYALPWSWVAAEYVVVLGVFAWEWQRNVRSDNEESLPGTRQEKSTEHRL